MARDIDDLIHLVRTSDSFRMGPILREVIVNRIEHPPTERELERARAQVMGRTPADALG